MNLEGDSSLERKRAAAKAALSLVPEGCSLGLGCGSTVKMFIHLLGEKVRQGFKVRAITACKESESLSMDLGVPLCSAMELFPLDMVVDGSDEIDSHLRLIKGGGGALLHEKILANAARDFTVIAEGEKLVACLGRFPLPVEVAPYGVVGTVEQIRQEASRLGCEGELRLRQDISGAPYVSDGGHWIYDCAFGKILDPEGLAAVLDGIAGVLGHGLFLGMATRVILGEKGGVRVLEK